MIPNLFTSTFYTSHCNSKEMVKDNTNLPFEVTYAQEPGKESRTMKRLAYLLRRDVSDIISSLKELNLEATIYDVKGSNQR